MIVAMVAVLVMQPTVDEIIDVITMGNRLVTAAGAMDMSRLVTLVTILRRAARRVRRADLDHVLGHTVPFGMMQVTVVEIVDMIVVAYG